jgi:hypothetical protein
MVRVVLLYLVLLVVMMGGATAQDTLRRVDGALLIGKVLVIEKNQVQFTKATDSSATFIISTTDLASIHFANGRRETFAAAPLPPPIREIPVHRGQNILGWRPADLLFTNFTFAYERLSASRKFSWRVPVSLGFNQATGLSGGSYARDKTFSSGLDLNFYVGMPDRFRYFVGPSFQFGFYRLGPSYISPTQVENQIGRRFAIVMHNGFWYQATGNLLLGADLGLGASRRSGHHYLYSYNNGWGALLTANLNLGIQF